MCPGALSLTFEVWKSSPQIAAAWLFVQSSPLRSLSAVADTNESQTPSAISRTFEVCRRNRPCLTHSIPASPRCEFDTISSCFRSQTDTEELINSDSCAAVFTCLISCGTWHKYKFRQLKNLPPGWKFDWENWKLVFHALRLTASALSIDTQQTQRKKINVKQRWMESHA